jgi:flagellar hook-basal body protein
MSFYTSLTGLNAATTQLSVTSNNIANVGTTGFKRSRADFGDIFATSPLQRASAVVGQGVSLKSVSQEFSQGNIQFSANSLDIAITGDGFFPLKSADSLQDIYTRNGTFLLNDSFAVVNSAGQSLMAAAVDSSGKADLGNLRKLIVPRSTTGDARETTAIELGLNLPANAQVVTAPFDRTDPSTYNLTTAITVFDQGGNEYLANVYYVKTQRASPDDQTNKWQTHVYIGDTKLDEFLSQAASDMGEKLFVNKYGQVKPESQIEPQLIARGVTKLFNLDQLTNRQASVPAEYGGDAFEAADLTLLKSGTFSIAEKLGPTDGPNGIAFRLNIDDSPTDAVVDLSDLYDVGAEPMSGVEMARILEARINQVYGDRRDFNLSSLEDGATADKVNLFRMRVATATEGNGEEDISVTIAAGDDIKSLSPARLEALINGALADKFAAGDLPILITAEYSASQQTYLFKSTTASEIGVKAYGTTSANEIFSLTQNYALVNGETGNYGGQVIPNGQALRDYNSNYTLSDQRYGVRVRFDDTVGVFSVLSGTTGDSSSVEVVAPAFGDSAAAAKFANFQKIFNFNPGIQDAEDVPTRGVRSTAAVVTGTAIGVNLDNKFRLNSETNKFTVTVDNVTGLVALPVGQDFTKESFRVLLEQRINSLQDTLGRTVSGVRVEFVNRGSQTLLKFTSGTEGDDSFLKVSGPSFWGLNDLESGRGKTERWIAPPQAVNSAGVALYVDRDGNETTEAGDFSEAESRDLWSAIYLDKGELTFDTGGNLVSPSVPIAFKPNTIGETGATLQFSIDYEGSTQYASGFAVLAQSQNGRPEGDLIGLNIGDDGLVSANYSNGTQKNLAKIILANFTAPTGLRQLGDSSYLATSQSGSATLGEAGTAGFGTVRAGARERANVDLTQELIELITSQRNFQANAKAIETNNTLTQAIINLRS